MILDPSIVHADFVGSPTAGIAPLFVSFTNQSTGDFAACAWTFGDGAAGSTCGNPVHTYQAAGSYTVSLTVSGLGGSDAEVKAGYVEVREKSELFLPLALRGCAGRAQAGHPADRRPGEGSLPASK